MVTNVNSFGTSGLGFQGQDNVPVNQLNSGDIRSAGRIIGNTFDSASGSFTTTTSNLQPGVIDNVPLRNAQALSINNIYNGFINIPTEMSVDPFFLNPANYAYYFQRVFDVNGLRSPSALTILAAGTQFQKELETEGNLRAIPGQLIFQVPGTDNVPKGNAIDYMGITDAAIGALTNGSIPGYSPYGQLYPSGPNGIGTIYEIPTVQAPTSLYTGGPSTYTHFAPFSGTGIVPGQAFYPTQNQGFRLLPNGSVVLSNGRALNSGYNNASPQSTLPSLGNLVNTIRNSANLLPGTIPFSGAIGDVLNFIGRFGQSPESLRVNLRQTLGNPTVADDNLLNTTGVDANGGKYNQGKVNTPFNNENFLRDTNPFARFGTGLVVTNGNENGKVRGTPSADILIGRQGNNIIDGRGGQDNIVGSTSRDLVNVRQGDWVSLDAGDDFALFDINPDTYTASRTTVIEAGGGNDIVTLAINGDPSQVAPTFRNLANGLLSVTMNGVQLITKAVERFYVTDKEGNIGGIYDVNNATDSQGNFTGSTASITNVVTQRIFNVTNMDSIIEPRG